MDRLVWIDGLRSPPRLDRWRGLHQSHYSSVDKGMYAVWWSVELATTVYLLTRIV